MKPQTHIAYLFDPLCGWCYGASPVIRELAAHPDIALELAPTGLFSGRGARPMDAQFANYAWSNDQRIAQLSGQTFSETYRNTVLGKRGSSLDTSEAALALTAVALTEPSRELAALGLLQEARCVWGKDVTDKAVVEDILTSAGVAAAADRLEAPDEVLLAENRRRVDAARALMADFGVDGVPASSSMTGAAAG
jgi:putative protein-disulfide isomerase